ncbi:DUF6301 family protein [Nocardia sp. IFM 10818]
MGFEVRVDTAGAVEIVRAALEFKWKWNSRDIAGFARQVGWSAPEPVGTMRRGAVFSRTGLGVWWDSAMFWGSPRVLGYVRATVSDCPARSGFGSSELLSDALGRLRETFTERWGEPENGAGPEEGPGWVFPNLVVGLAIGDNTVDVLLVNPAEQLFWMERRHEGARRRAELGGWGRLAEDLAGFLETLPAGARLVISAPGGRYVQVNVSGEELYAELSRSEFVDPTWRYGAEVEQRLIAGGWAAPGDANWWRRLPRKAGTLAVSRFATRLVEGLRALSVRATTDLVADAWVEGGADLDIAPLGIPLHPTSRSQRAEFLRQHAISAFDTGPLAVDVPGGIEIAAAARAFDWTWKRGDLQRFSERAGWTPQGTAAAADRTAWAGTPLHIDEARARFTFDGDRLESIRVTLSDSIESHLFDEGLPAEVGEQLTAAFTRALEGFRAELGTPVHGVIGQAHGPVWATPGLTLGLVAEHDTVDLYLVNPAERARRLVLEQQHTGQRAAGREWRQFFDDLAGLVLETPEDQEVIVDAGTRGSTHLVRTPDALLVHLDTEAALGLAPRVTDLMLGNGWQRPGVDRACWRHSMRLPALFRDHRHFVEFALWPLRTRMTPDTTWSVRIDGMDQGLRSPSTGATGS